jgi:hypothetical protein
VINHQLIVIHFMRDLIRRTSFMLKKKLVSEDFQLMVGIIISRDKNALPSLNNFSFLTPPSIERDERE